MSDNEITPGIGHNVPPTPSVATQGEMQAFLEAGLSGLMTRRSEVSDGLDELPVEIGDDDEAQIVIENLGMADKFCTTAEEARKEITRPYLDTQRYVKSWFDALVHPVQLRRQRVRLTLTAYQQKVAAAERQRREAEARIAEAEAKRKADEAAAALREQQNAADVEAKMAQAAKAAAEADRATSDAAGTQADMSRARGVYGSVASLRTVWKWRVTDRNAVPREFMMIDEAKVREAARERDPDSKKPTAVIPGIEWYAEAVSQVRR